MGLLCWGLLSLLFGNHNVSKTFKNNIPGLLYQEAEAGNGLVGDNPGKERFNKGTILFVFRWSLYLDVF